MDLKTYLREHPDMELFESAKDNQQVLQFMNGAPMNVGGIELLYDRTPEFQKLLNCQSENNYTFLGKNKSGHVMGLFSVSIAKKWILGEKKLCAYIGDFRTDNSRHAAKTWRRVYAEILSLLQKDLNSEQPVYFLTAILKKNAEAVKNLTQTRRDLGFRYELLKEINMINVYGLWPWKKSSPLAVEAAKETDLKKLKEFLNQKEQKNLFGSIFDGSPDDVWVSREKNWPGFQIESFLLIKDKNQKILACTLPWNPDAAKRMKVLKAPWILRAAFKILSWVGFGTPAVGDSLQTSYLTHLHWEESLDANEVLGGFVKEVFKKEPTVHMVSFPDSSGFSKNFKGAIIQKIPVLLYSVALKGTPSLPGGSEVGFEMGLV